MTPVFAIQFHNGGPQPEHATNARSICVLAEVPVTRVTVALASVQNVFLALIKDDGVAMSFAEATAGCES